MRRFGQPEDLLGTLLWLADDATSRFVTGITVPSTADSWLTPVYSKPCVEEAYIDYIPVMNRIQSTARRMAEDSKG